MKRFFLFAGLIIITIFFIACDGTGDPEPTPVPTAEPDYVEIEIVTAGADPVIPATYDPNDGTTIDFSGTVMNNGRDLSGTDEVIYFSLYVDDTTGQDFTSLYTSGEIVSSYGDTLGINGGATKDYSLDAVDISTSGTTGDNYFYIVVYVYDGTQFALVPDQISSVDNVIQLNTSPCVKQDLPHVSWGGPTTLAGGADFSSAVAMPLMEHWYTSSVAWPNYMWYSVSVSIGTTYDIYLDDDGEGSGSYTGDVQMSIYETNGSDFYTIGSDCYNTPLSVTPTETTILIRIYPDDVDGSFAIGIMEQ